MTLDDRLEPQIMNNDTCMECGVNFKTTKEAILSDLLEMLVDLPTENDNFGTNFYARIVNENNALIREQIRGYCE